MQTQFARCVPHQSLTDALEIMGDEDVGWVPVVAARDDSRFLGWITARRAAVHLGVFDKRPSEVMCRELIEPPEAVLAPEEDWSAACATAARYGRRRLPVVQEGRLVGVVACG